MFILSLANIVTKVIKANKIFFVTKVIWSISLAKIVMCSEAQLFEKNFIMRLLPSNVTH